MYLNLFQVWKARTPNEKGVQSLIALRRVHEHARRRKPWSRAFNTNAIKGYEPIVHKRALQLVSILERKSASRAQFDGATITEDQALNLAGWLSYFT